MSVVYARLHSLVQWYNEFRQWRESIKDCTNAGHTSLATLGENMKELEIDYGKMGALNLEKLPICKVGLLITFFCFS